MYQSAMPGSRLAAVFPNSTSYDNYTVLYQDPGEPSSQIQYGPFYYLNASSFPYAPTWIVSGTPGLNIGPDIIGGAGWSGSFSDGGGGGDVGDEGDGGDEGDVGDEGDGGVTMGVMVAMAAVVAGVRGGDYELSVDFS